MFELYFVYKFFNEILINNLNYKYIIYKKNIDVKTNKNLYKTIDFLSKNLYNKQENKNTIFSN
mgnify:CR=1 FL=1